ncbi:MULTISPECIES: arginine--tRNA ligase [Burkholderia]|uniref:Arginine--tRNA ligase n=2 Tax=Burkholderia vietnamiensis TaxID=60552 RepID=SYR_BURVG|nr:arginine--tRNA ligase [Burkholderia vietnamiensis]A4JIA2.1 RecName: Full=Arginine--tRNA ligase; AltName: Full=Arginyl-tRNA synthetase; Short=ArgRS [Burkholderia vietnamiensis G4]ABO56005.1 arginyl-tRNA synthetase [Burkholderia vietnamiensis G4]AJY05575.1 arginine--tRNA ligase [Burkholderia vietnamiensis LMG 10929]AVR16268.1 arginine--tRNA ligase [Burkholderia vietnamiensis]KKI35208.1 arginine--tRNA ligase [Burkholderia vietnamiensis]KVF32183.1 arginine--tRNA ligase [Burkholderia vietnamien
MLPAHKQTLEALLADSVAQVAHALKGADAEFVIPAITLERPKVAAHGDVACNVAMQLAKPLGTNPRQLAERIVAALVAQPAAQGLVDAAEIAGPGFINLRVSAAAKQAVIAAVFEQGRAFGTSQREKGKRVLVEFVSANPTGPLHVGHGRQAALGDVLANVIASQGYAVHREFYYNDAGVQIANLAISTQARARGLKPGDAGWPEAAYNGEYIADIARDYLNGATVAAKDGEPVTGARDIENLDAIRKFAVAYLRHEQDMDLQAFGVKFDQYYLESSLYSEGRVEKTVDALVKAGMTYEQDGALWLRTTDEGDDKDRVMRKSDGTYTYFVPDVAYHVTKWERGFTKVINIQGSDHHGTIARVRAGLQGLHIGIPKGYPDYVLHKMVTVMRDGQEVKLSKRAGSYVTVRDLIEWSGGAAPGQEAAPDMIDEATITRGRDAVRFFLISRKADTEFVFDIDLALKQNDENPVYYVQYAHARICSVLNELKARYNVDVAQLPGADLSQLTSPQAVSLMQKLAEYPDLLTHAANELAPHAVAFYLRDLAGEFHSFYNAERVLVDDEAPRNARAALLAATRQVLENGLAMLGVSAPAKM